MWSLAENVNPGRRCVHHADGLECREGLSAFSSQLQAYRQQLPAGRKLVFGKLGGREDAPDGHLLRRLKILVKKAGLGCGTCATCLAKTGCENWWLHKFRATYIRMSPSSLSFGLNPRSSFSEMLKVPNITCRFSEEKSVGKTHESVAKSVAKHLSPL